MIPILKAISTVPIDRFVRALFSAALMTFAVVTAASSAALAQESALVQIGALRTPAIGPDGKQVETIVTLFLEVPDLAAASKVCERIPQLRDAYVRLTHARPFPSLGRMIDSSIHEAGIADAFNKFLGPGIVRQVFAMAGTPVESAGPMTRTMQREAKSGAPEGRSVRASGEDCRPIVALPPEADEQMRAQRGRRIAAAQSAAQARGRTAVTTPSATAPDQPIDATSPWFWIAFVAGLVVLFGGAGLMYWLISRHRAATRRRHADRRMAAADRRQGDRRKGPDPSYAGPERRQSDRRAAPRRSDTDRRSGQDRRR